MEYPKNVVAVTLGGGRWEKCQESYPGVVPFYGLGTDDITDDLRPRWMHPNDREELRRVAIALTFHRLVPWLAEEGYNNLDTLVIQDDARFFSPIPDYSSSTVFGKLRDGHLCPQAWSFSADTYEKLAPVWDGKRQICLAWSPVVKDLTVVPIASD